ncbi:hypothetical protein U9M73_05985 [Paenibacillus phoenicis]|uniref:Multidrug transporter n=1 Tax=Paenibacillus phoenicis TaxID=554117 RepID=A0ABU5PHY2_9BACL|nr:MULTISPECIES: hypothetical protein [Paenibacillus]MCT2197180.1 hypothetical protein [Paenibacillus sp. p3-SID1389]MEA3569546.1 hypothetical protein [Paenibacillus phoenicis]
MPNQKHENIETDGDPRTIYEDTSPHLRTGFMPEQTDVTSFESEERNPEQDQTRS